MVPLPSQVWHLLLHTHIFIHLPACQSLPLDSPQARKAWRSCFLTKQIGGFFSHCPSCSHEKQSALKDLLHKLLHRGAGGKWSTNSPPPGTTLQRREGLFCDSREWHFCCFPPACNSFKVWRMPFLTSCPLVDGSPGPFSLKEHRLGLMALSAMFLRIYLCALPAHTSTMASSLLPFWPSPTYLGSSQGHAFSGFSCRIIGSRSKIKEPLLKPGIQYWP